MGMKDRGQRSIFDRLPPLFINGYTGRFHIDYASLFMFERIIVDEKSFEKAINPLHNDVKSQRMSPTMMEAIEKGGLGGRR